MSSHLKECFYNRKDTAYFYENRRWCLKQLNNLKDVNLYAIPICRIAKMYVYSPCIIGKYIAYRIDVQHMLNDVKAVQPEQSNFHFLMSGKYVGYNGNGKYTFFDKAKKYFDVNLDFPHVFMTDECYLLEIDMEMVCHRPILNMNKKLVINRPTWNRTP